MTRALTLACALLAILLAARSCEVRKLAAERDRLAGYADSLATVTLAADLARDSALAVSLASRADVAALLAERDEWRTVAEQLRAANARAAALVDAAVTARGEVRVAVAEIDTTAADTVYRAEFADGPLSGTVTTPVPLPWMDLTYRLYLPLSAALSWAPDGRPLLVAQYTGPPPGYGTVDIELQDFRYEPPPVAKVKGPSRLKCALAAGLSGAVVALQPDWWTAGGGLAATVWGCW